MTPALFPVCQSTDLEESGLAVSFEVLYDDQPCRAFAVRAQGKAQAYLNQCTHIAMEMDYQPNRFFDESGQWLMCATHGATYDASTGRCLGGPCKGGLIKIDLIEKDGLVQAQASSRLQSAAPLPTAPQRPDRT